MTPFPGGRAMVPSSLHRGHPAQGSRVPFLPGRARAVLLVAAAVATSLAGPTLPASADDSVSVEALVASHAEVQRLLGPLPSDEAGRSGYRAQVALEGAVPIGWSDDGHDLLDVDVTLVTGGPTADGGAATPSLDLVWTLRDCDADGVCDAGRQVVSVSDAAAALDALEVTVKPARLRVQGTVPVELLELHGLAEVPLDLTEGVQVDLDIPLPKSLRAKTSAVVTGDVVLTTSDDASRLTWSASRSADVDLPERVERVATLWPDTATATVTRAWAGTIDRPLTLPTLGGARASALMQTMSFDAATFAGQVELTTDEPVLTDAGVPLRGTRQVSRLGVMLSSSGGPWSAGAAFRAGLTHLDCASGECSEVGRGEDGAGLAPTLTSDGDLVQASVGTATPAGLVTTAVDVRLGDVVPTLTVTAVRATDGGWRWTSRLELVANQGTYTGTINGTPATVRVLQPLTWKADVDSWRTASRDGPSLPGASGS